MQRVHMTAGTSADASRRPAAAHRPAPHRPDAAWPVLQARGTLQPATPSTSGLPVHDDEPRRRDAEASGTNAAVQRRQVEAVRGSPYLADQARQLRRLFGAGALPGAAPVAPARPGFGPLVAQRMLIQLGNDVAQDTNARRLRESNPLEFRDGTPGSLVPGEVLHLLAHSGGNSFAGRSPYGLFRHLVGQGLSSDSVSAIQLHGCESTEFAAGLEHLLNQDEPKLNWLKPQGRPIKVRGIPGYSVVSTSGRNFSIGRDKGNDAVWGQIGVSVNRDPSNARLKGYRQQHPGEIRQIRRLRSRPEVKGQVLGPVLASLAYKVETVNFDRFARPDLISLGAMVDRVIAIMQMPVAPLGAMGRDHERKIQNEIRKKLREITPAVVEDVEPEETEPGIDLDALGTFPDAADAGPAPDGELGVPDFNALGPAAAQVEQPLDNQDEWDAIAAELEALNQQWANL